MLDLKEMTYQHFIGALGKLSPDADKRVRIAYDHMTSYVEEVALMVYVSTTPRSVRVAADLREVAKWIFQQVPKVEGVDPYSQVEAVTVLERYNEMNLVYGRYRREHSELELPYAEFAPCRWYLDVLRFLQGFKPEEYPLMNSWHEFFLILPGLSDSGKRIQIKFFDYQKMVDRGEFEKWYVNNKMYGSSKSGFSSQSFRESYIEELQGMSTQELQEEKAKHGWGFRLVLKEAQRRGHS